MAKFQVDDLWRPEPGKALPGRPVLRQIAQRCGAAWEMPDLADRVRIGYNQRLRTSLGRAVLNEDLVELNPRLLLDHPAELIPTLVHELAHLAVYLRYGRVQPHGIQFRTLMRAVNHSAAATHDLPVEGLRRKRRKYLYLHRCDSCGSEFVDRKVCRNRYYCTDCGPEMHWDVFRVPDTPAGRAMLEEHLK